MTDLGLKSSACRRSSCQNGFKFHVPRSNSSIRPAATRRDRTHSLTHRTEWSTQQLDGSHRQGQVFLPAFSAPMALSRLCLRASRGNSCSRVYRALPRPVYAGEVDRGQWGDGGREREIYLWDLPPLSCIQHIVMHTLHYNTIQYNTLQDSTIQYNTVQYKHTLLIASQDGCLGTPPLRHARHLARPPACAARLFLAAGPGGGCGAQGA